MPLRERLYKPNQTIIKILGYGDNKKIKVTTCKWLRTSGLDYSSKVEQVRGVNDSKLECNISRAKTQIFEYAFCNPWDYFFTGTIDSTKLDRKNLDEFHKQFNIFIKSFNRKYHCKVKYIIVPELHQDGENWHIHGLLYGLPKETIIQYEKNKGYKINKSILDLMDKGTPVYYWNDYQNKFGYCNLTELKNAESVSKYITKYINKDLGCSVKELNAHLYYCSKGLEKGLIIEKGTMFCENIVPDFENDYVSIKTFPYSDETLNYLCNSIVHTIT